MRKPEQHNSRISRIVSRMTRTAVALAVMSALMFASRAAHAQFKVLYSFTGGTDGGQPNARVIAGIDGNLYGTAPFGGDLSCSFGQGCGVVYRLTKAGTETVVHGFAGGADGADPYQALVTDVNGNLYGTTTSGGAKCAGSACGTVFEISADGKETVLYSFTGGADGGGPSSGLIVDKAGDLYGTTAFGGLFSVGTVFRLDPAGHETVLYSFTGVSDGAYPGLDRLAVDAEGNLYGITASGGDLNCNSGTGCGTVFKLTQAGVLTVLHTFANGADGSFPSGVILDPKGNLYGTTQTGGAGNNGVLFKISDIGTDLPSGTFRVLLSFGPSQFAVVPIGNVTVCADGNIYGISQGGGSTGWGTLWKVDQTGEGTVVHSFDFVPSGGHPSASSQWSQGIDGAVFYGTAPEGGSNSNGRGLVYSMDVDSQQQKCVP
jgi:uncharacterized repeat protein (TIGR03803 family)